MNTFMWRSFYYSIMFGATFLVLTSPGISQAQMKSSILYCCQDDAGKKVCGDKQAHCWGRKITLINSAGIVVGIKEPPESSEEIRKRLEKEALLKQEEEALAAEEKRFQYLLGLYGSPENIDKEIERQRLENIENGNIAESRLRTAKENVQLFKEQKGEALSAEAQETLSIYESTVVAIEQELVARKEQADRSRERLLEDKKKLVDYRAAKDSRESAR